MNEVGHRLPLFARDGLAIPNMANVPHLAFQRADDFCGATSEHSVVPTKGQGVFLAADNSVTVEQTYSPLQRDDYLIYHRVA